ncbi:MAG: carbohydrate kinase family protein [Thermoanaerobaculia bacterium]
MSGSERSVVVTGSVAYDYLMKFPGRFLEHFLPDRLHHISVSFLVDEMRKVRGGCAPNIAYGLALLGEHPRIVASAGCDAADYRDWLAAQGVRVEGLRIFDDLFTASFFVSTDLDQNQIASFYAGAMARASDLSLRDGIPGEVAYAIISPNDPAAMARYARECREAGIAFLYDPSQQVARLSGADLLAGMEGAAVLICNDYEWGIVLQKTNLHEEEILSRVKTLIVTHGAEGASFRTGSSSLQVPAARLRGPAVDPTGVGDAFRAGLLKGMLRGDPWDMCGRIASVAAAFCLESVGPQPPRMTEEVFADRFRESYGPGAQLSGLFKPVLA